MNHPTDRKDAKYIPGEWTKQPTSQQSIDIDEILDDLPNAWCEVCEHPVCIDKKKSVKQALIELILSCVGEDTQGVNVPEQNRDIVVNTENKVKAEIRQNILKAFGEGK